jgi:adenosylmethionine-8-amino-7-oxononanoate aminotransferase
MLCCDDSTTDWRVGSEAVESALKIARQYHVCNDEPERVNIIGRESSYHGNTFGALSAGHHRGRRGPFTPMLSPVFHHVAPCFFDRDAREGEDETSYVNRLLAQAEDRFIQLDPRTVAAMIVEPVSGATLGAVPASPGYLKGLRGLCNKYGALLIFDEVMCGMGRVGSMHAWQSLDTSAPDLQTIGKGLAGGYQPISGVLFSKKISEALTQAHPKKPFMSGHTYQDHPIGCAAAVATQKAIIHDDLLQNVRAMGSRLKQRLEAQTPCIKQVRGMGLFVAAEFATASCAIDPIAAEVASTCLKQGAAVYLCSDLVDAILFAPPYIITSTEIDELVAIFVASAREVLTKRGIDFGR